MLPALMLPPALMLMPPALMLMPERETLPEPLEAAAGLLGDDATLVMVLLDACLLYTSPSPRDS